MKALHSLFKTNYDPVQTLLRLALAGVIFPHGAQKVLGWFGGHGFEATMQNFTQTMHIPAFFAFLAILAESLGPIALLFGFLTRIAAFGLAVMITVAALMAHVANGFFMNWMGNQKGEGIEYHILFLALALAVLFRGAGRWAVDNLIHRKLARRETWEPFPGGAHAPAR